MEHCVYVDHVGAIVEKLRAAGVPILVEPVEQPWGERDTWPGAEVTPVMAIPARSAPSQQT